MNLLLPSVSRTEMDGPAANGQVAREHLCRLPALREIECGCSQEGTGATTWSMLPVTAALDEALPKSYVLENECQVRAAL